VYGTYVPRNLANAGRSHKSLNEKVLFLLNPSPLDHHKSLLLLLFVLAVVASFLHLL